MLFSLLRLASLGTIRLFRSGLRPACLDHLDIDLEASTNESAISTSDELLLKVTDQVEDGDLDRAVAIWSDHVETHLLDHRQELPLPGRRYKGRCQKVAPRAVKLAPARLKGGRATDFTPEVYSSLQVRQWTKQVRRLKCYRNATVALQEDRGKPGLKGDRVRLWGACLEAPGGPKRFMGWLRGAGFGDPGCLPPPSWCDGVLQHLESETHKIARNLSAYKPRIFCSY